MANSNYVYFLYSEEQIVEKNKILEKQNKVFNPGTVVANGVRKQYTQKSSSSTMSRFFDCKVVAEGYEDQFVYEAPSSTFKKGN